jgi:hypothetical protein
LGPTQPPVQWVPGLSRGSRVAWAWRWPFNPLLVPLVMKEQSYTSTPPMGRTACTVPRCLYKGALYLFLPYIAGWFPKTINSHSEYIMLIAFPLPRWLHASASMLRLCIYCVSCSYYVHGKWRLMPAAAMK